MTRKNILILVLTLILIALPFGYAYQRTSLVDTCDFQLRNQPENRICVATNFGVMVFETYPESTPIALEKLKDLSNGKHFYDGLTFYRISKDFVIQGGVQDLKAKYAGLRDVDTKTQAKLDLYDNNKFDSEANFDKLNLNAEDKSALEQDGYKSNTKLDTKVFGYGSFAFANAGPNTNSTEFFIVTSKDIYSSNVKYLNGRFSNMGKIISGQSVLDKLNTYSDVASANPEIPVRKINIIEIRVK